MLIGKVVTPTMAWLKHMVRTGGSRPFLAWVCFGVLGVTACADSIHYYFPTDSITAPANQPPWPTELQWTALPGLETDTDDGFEAENDFVGQITDHPAPAGSWYNGSSYLFFRMQVDSVDPLTDYNTPFTNDVYAVVIDRAGAGGRIDYAFSWDVQNELAISNHGLELNVPVGAYTTSSLWSDVQFADRDGNNGQKFDPDLNAVDGSFDSAGTDGYIRATQTAAATFVDVAISWGYLTSPYSGSEGGPTVTTLTRNDTLYVAMATRHTGTDHSAFSGITDIIGATSADTLTSGFSGGINPVPEPGMALLSLLAAGLLAARRPLRRTAA